jgi:hypothetical protein
MTKVTKYDELLDLIKSLKKGDSIAISPDDVSPYLISALAKLSLAPVTLSFEEKSDDTIIKGRGKLFEIDDVGITMKFGPTDPHDAKGPFLLQSISSSLPDGTEWKLIDGFKIFAMEIIFEPNLELEIYSASIGCKLLIGGDNGLSLDIRMLIPPSKTDWMIIGEFDATPLNQNSFNALTGKMYIKEFLPEGLCNRDNFLVRSIELAFNPLNGTFSFLYFVIEYNDDWSLFDEIIEVKKEDIKLSFMVYLQEFENTYIELDSTFCIESVPINLGAHFAKNNFYVWGKLADGSIISINKILTHFKIDIPRGLPEIDIIHLGLLADISNKSFELDLESKIDAGKDFKISSLRANLNVDFNKRDIKGEFAATIAIEDTTHLFLRAKYDGKDKGLKFEGDADNIRIGALISYLDKKLGIADIPKSLETLTIKKLKTSYDTELGNFAFAISGEISVADTNLSMDLTIGATHQDDKYVKTLDGTLKLGSATFKIKFAEDARSTEIIASWKLIEGQTLGLKEIAKALGLTPPDIPEELDFGLNAASFAYDTSKGTFVLIASTEFGKATFAARKGNNSWQLFFGIAIGQTISLLNMPLIKSIAARVSPEEDVEIRDIQVLIASNDLDKAAASDMNNLIDAAIALINKAGLYFGELECVSENADFPDYPKMIADGMKNGIILSMIFKAGTFQTPFRLSLSGKSALMVDDSPRAAMVGLPQDTSYLTATTVSDTTVWYNLQKTFGPVSFQKVGIRYKDSILYVLMNASLGAGGLMISVLGLGVGSPLKKFQPKFNIDGLAIAFKEGPVDISGGLIGTLDPTINFYGELIIGFPGWNISALGGYAEVEKHPSFFLYAVLNRPIGGPSFFFVTGLAAGFGFNRKLMIPDVSQVATFPLIQWAMGSKDTPGMIPGADMGKQVTEVLTKLSASGVVAPSLGDYWLALGIRFTSFKLLDSFVLLTVSFGTTFEVNLLGMSRLTIPPAPAPAVAMVELALKASFSPSKGELSVLGQLTSNSFLFSRECHLTGGFAVCAWFKGQNAGDFVITLGGYSPRFLPPAHYPKVPRLGLNWNVNSKLTIKGNLYFALTPNAVMAGGGLSAVWTSGSIKAWFDLQADFLMVFQPFHYYLSASVHLGGSVSINLLFTRVTLTINLGAGLEIWGPPFSGKAEVNLKIFSFTIAFGEDRKKIETTVSWEEFKKGLMPTAASPVVSRSRNMRSVLSRGTPEGDAKPSIVQILISGGLLKTLSEKDGELNYVVSAEGFELTTQTAIPAKEPDPKPFSGNLVLADQQPSQKPNKNFGVGPTGTDSFSFSSIHSIFITAKSGQYSKFRAIRVLGNVPKALWEMKSFDGHGVPTGINPLEKTTVRDVLVGYKVVPDVFVPDETPSINVEDLLHTIDRYQFEWSHAYYPREDGFSDETVPSTIGTPLARKNRESFLRAMVKIDLNRPEDIDVSDLEDSSRYYLLAKPGICLLGEQRQRKV